MHINQTISLVDMGLLEGTDSTAFTGFDLIQAFTVATMVRSR